MAKQRVQHLVAAIVIPEELNRNTFKQFEEFLTRHEDCLIRLDYNQTSYEAFILRDETEEEAEKRIHNKKLRLQSEINSYERAIKKIQNQITELENDDKI